MSRVVETLLVVTGRPWKGNSVHVRDMKILAVTKSVYVRLKWENEMKYLSTRLTLQKNKKIKYTKNKK